LKNKTAGAVVFTDLDGTLLTSKFSYRETQPLIKRLLALNVHIALCSSKTKLEIEFYREKLGIKDPFISENGAAIFIPRNYFKPNPRYGKQPERYDIIELGVPYQKVRQHFERIRQKCACKIIGFGDMTAEEIAQHSGLTLELAKLAKQREYSEPFRIEGKQKRARLFEAIRQECLSYAKGGKYYHLTGNHDKGKAVTILKWLYKQEFGRLTTYGVGDEPNDISMLAAVDHPVWVRRTDKLQSVWETITSLIQSQSKEN